jgi:Excreted virulence factor EspC, type VII ESX diderm
MSRDGFRVNPDALYQLATVFEGAAEYLDSARSAFISRTAEATPGVFGLFPTAQDAYRMYLELMQQAADGLRSVHAALGSGLAQGLRSSAGSYVETDDNISRAMP